jgi:hypothetical protein
MSLNVIEFPKIETEDEETKAAILQHIEAFTEQVRAQPALDALMMVTLGADGEPSIYCYGNRVELLGMAELFKVVVMSGE